MALTSINAGQRRLVLVISGYSIIFLRRPLTPLHGRPSLVPYLSRSALHETICLMKEIDEVIEKHGGWPSAFISAKENLKNS